MFEKARRPEDNNRKRHLWTLLQKTQRRLKFTERAANIGYWEFDITDHSVYWSAEMYRLFETDFCRNICKNNLIQEQIPREDRLRCKNVLKELRQQGKRSKGLIRLQRPAETRYCQYNAYLIKEDGQDKIAGTLQDITDLIEAQNALKQAKDAAERANHEKSRFLAHASHDLRQPMQALKLYLAALAEHPLPQTLRELTNKAEISAENLRLMLDNFLDVSRLDVGGIKYHPREFDIGGLMLRIASESADLAAEKSIKFHCLGRKQTVWGDPVLIERIIRNLLENALKFTRNKIVLGSRKEKNKLRIMILDNGNGIIPEEKELIFKEFYQSRRQKGRQYGGSGLGLAIVNKLTMLMKSRLDLDTIPGRGSCFSFTLPLYKPAENS